ncbi:MAG: YdcF family protein [Bdellovibrionota bacterium]|nr:YdcF family protein [Bdellovibrionota bacterium]
MEYLEELDPRKEEKEAKEINWKLWLSLCVLVFIFSFLILRQSQEIIATPISSWTEDQRADCGLVLTGGAARISEGFSLLSQNRIKKLVISGVNPNSKLHEIFPQLVFYGNLSEEDILLEKRSKTTYGNAQQSAVLIDALNCKDIILITSWYHMKRASKTLRSSLPNSFPVYHRAVIYGSKEFWSTEVFFEAIKSLFYGLWAY